MQSIIITPKSFSEHRFVSELLKKLNVSLRVISEDEKEDMGLSLLMKKVDRTKKVSRDTIMKKLKK